MATSLFDRWGLSPRERRLATILLGVAGFIMLVAVPALLQSFVLSRRSDNDELRSALAAVQQARGQVHDRQARKASIAQRYAKRAPALAGFIEQHARSQKLEVTDSVDRPDVPHGKRYVERSSQVHLKKAGMYAIAKFIEEIEKSGSSVAVTRLNIRKRSGEPDSYDVEIGVSAYDRNEAPAAEEKKEEKK
jgi:general secretion pathway protein M